MLETVSVHWPCKSAHLWALMKAEMRGTEWEQKLDHWSGGRWEQ
jgi:hypothetical protein